MGILKLVNYAVKHIMKVYCSNCLNIIEASLIAIIVSMSNNLKVGIALVAALFAGGAVAGYNKFVKRGKKLDSKALELILLEIKYQMFAYCLSFAQATRNVLAKLTNDEAKRTEIKEEFKRRILAVFQEKQKLILLRYDVSKNDLESSLDKPELLTPEINKLSEEIETLMLDAIAGKKPDINVPDELKKRFPVDATFALFRDLLCVMLEEILTAFQKQVEVNPDFNDLDADQFLKVIRKVKLFQIKWKHLEDKNFKSGNLCPNELLAKLMEQYKLKDKQFTEKCKQLEDLYEQMIDTFSNSVESASKEMIRSELGAIKHSKEDKAQLHNSQQLMDEPKYYRQASSATEKLSKWVHADKQIVNQIAQAVKGGYVHVEKPGSKAEPAVPAQQTEKHEEPKTNLAPVPEEPPKIEVKAESAPKVHEQSAPPLHEEPVPIVPEEPAPQVHQELAPQVHEEPANKQEEKPRESLPEEKEPENEKQAEPVVEVKPHETEPVNEEKPEQDSPNEDAQDKAEAETNEPQSAQKEEVQATDS